MHTLTQLIHRRLMEAAGDDAAAAGGGDGGGGGGSDDAAVAAAKTEVEQRARNMGWSPKDQWQGHPDSWIDANEFVHRGEQMLPILRSNMRKGEAKIASLEAELKKTNTALQSANESIQVLTNISSEQSRAAAKERRRELLRQQAQARTDGDTDREIEIGEQIADVTSQINAAPAEEAPVTKPVKGAKSAAAPATTPAADPVQSPEWQQWSQENSWFGTDRRKTALATAIAEELRSDPANAGLVGKPFFDRVTAEVNRTLGIGGRATTSKVEGNAPGGGRGAATDNNSPSNGKTYADLPADAKAACERDARILVGEGKAFKTIADWRKHYVTAYFNS